MVPSTHHLLILIMVSPGWSLEALHQPGQTCRVAASETRKVDAVATAGEHSVGEPVREVCTDQRCSTSMTLVTPPPHVLGPKYE